MKKNLILLTAQFPFGNSETFLETELPLLADRFEQIYVFSQKSGETKRPLPKNVAVETLSPQPRPSKFRALNPFLKQLCYARNRYKHLARFRFILSRIQQQLGLAEALKSRVNAQHLYHSDTTIYSYWFDDWAAAITLDKKFTKYSRVTRAHGFDLYDYRNPAGFIEMRNVHFKGLSQVMTVSEDGCRYLKMAFPKHAHKISVHRLGVTSHQKVRPEQRSGLTIVSCSSIIPLKRVHRIAEALKMIEDQVHWHHFGDGPEREHLEKTIGQLPANVQVTLHGNKANQDILAFYASTRVDLFVNTSLYEGVPVSIMEAISYGIPVVATDVGGVKEMVSKDLGILLLKDFANGELAQAIVKTSNLL